MRIFWFSRSSLRPPMKVFTFLAVVALVAATVVLAQCPYASNPAAADGKAVPAGHPPVVATTFSQSRGRSLNAAPGQDYASLVSKVDFEALKKDLQLMFTYSRSFWPADFGHYGPFLVRQAWVRLRFSPARVCLLCWLFLD